VKSLWLAGFAVLALAFTGLFATGVYATITDQENDPPEVAARKAKCRALARHLFEILPEGKGTSADDVVPIEDIDLCSAAYPEAVTCMGAAHDEAGVRNCLPEPVECEKSPTVVDGKRPIYEVGGNCDVVAVKTTNAFVAVRAGKRVELSGAGNLIRVYLGEDAPKPAIADTAAGNRVEFEIKK
jgi:hypothetical protein